VRRFHGLFQDSLHEAILYAERSTG
jgi:hypothetical protein